MAGEVAAAGSLAEDLAPGTRVTANPLVTCGVCEPCQRGRPTVCESRHLLGLDMPGCFAEYVAAPRRNIFRIPDGMDYSKASMAEPLSTSVNVFTSHARLPVSSVAVFGSGPQGLLALQVARAAGASKVFVVDVNESRLAVAKRLGATHVINASSCDPVAAVVEMTGGRGCDVVVEASGRSAVRLQCVKAAARSGIVALVGLGEPAAEFDCLDIVNREVELHGVYAYTPANFRRALDLIAEGRVDVTSWVGEGRLEDGQKIMEKLTSNPGDLIKVSFKL